MQQLYKQTWSYVGVQIAKNQVVIMTKGVEIATFKHQHRYVFLVKL